MKDSVQMNTSVKPASPLGPSSPGNPEAPVSPLMDKAMNQTNETPIDLPTDVTVAVAIAEQKLRRHVVDALERFSIPVLGENCGGDSVEELIASVERLRPRILMLGLPELPGDPYLVLSLILKLDPAPIVVVVNDSAEPETILKVIRLGAAEFVYPPLKSAAFEEAMRRVVVQSGRIARAERSAGAVIGFVSAKGGCGATTLACHSSSHLRRMAKKEVLLADLDMACGITPSIMQAVSRYSLDDALQNLHRMDLKLWKAMVATAPSGVDVIPAPAETLAAVPISRRMPQMLRFWRMQYDFTMIDLGHGITPVLLDVLDSIDTLVLVATNEVPALRQAKQMIQTLAERNFGANRLKLVINRMPKRTQIELPELEKVMGHPIHFAIPNDYERMTEAYSEPRLLDPNCDLGAHIGKFTSKLAGLVAEEKKPRSFFGLRGKK